MRNLLSAGFIRLRKDKVFWLLLLVMLLCAVVNMLNGCHMAMADDEQSSYVLEDFFFSYAPTLGIFCSIYAGLSMGTEYSEGTIRNKLVAGHVRRTVYLSNLMLCFAATFCIALVWLAGGLVGMPFLGGLRMEISQLLLMISIILLMVAALSAISTFIGMVCSNKAVASVVSLLLIMGLLVLASVIYNRLCEPEMTSGIVMTMEGMQITDPEPNPYYVGGMLRKIYEFIIDFLPTGQGIQMANMEIGHPVRLMICSVAITLATTFGGMFLFEKKDIK